MIQCGPNIKSQTQLASTTSTTAALSVSQLVVFNSIKQLRTSQPSPNFQHKLDRETPLPLYLGLKVHAVTHSKTLVNILNNLGLCVSYDHVLQIQSNISNRIVSTMRRRRLSDHRICVVICSRLQEWTILTITQLLQQQRILFTELPYHSCNTKQKRSVTLIEIGILLIQRHHLPEQSMFCLKPTSPSRQQPLKQNSLLCLHSKGQ